MSTSMNARVSQCLSGCPIFSGVPQDALTSMALRVCTTTPFEAGNVVFRSGDVAAEMYFVLEGEVEIRSGGGPPLAVARKGGYFGEIGVLFEGCRQAHAIVSKGACQLAILRRDDLQHLSPEHVNCILANCQSLPHVREWFVAKLPIFTSCLSEPDFMKRVASALQVRTARPGEVLVREGDLGDDMFFIFKGAVEISYARGGATFMKIAPDFFGELALLYGEPRSASVGCASQCRLYTLGREAFQSILQDFPNTISRLYTATQEASNLKDHFIRKIPLFQPMAENSEFIANLCTALKSQSFKPGEFLVREGEKRDCKMFAIAYGQAEVRQSKSLETFAVRVGMIGAGDFFGECALLLDEPRAASVIACSHCHVYTLTRDAFETLAVAYEDWWKYLMSERSTLLEKMKLSGTVVSDTMTTHTHGLVLPQLPMSL